MKNSLRQLGVLLPLVLAAQSCCTSKGSGSSFEKPPPSKVSELGQLQTEHLPVARGTRAWFTKALQQHLGVTGRWFVGYHDGTCHQFELPMNAGPARHLVAVDTGLYFAIRAADRDQVWFVDTSGKFTEQTGDPIVVHTMCEDAGRLLVLGSSVPAAATKTTGVYEAHPGDTAYRPVTVAAASASTVAPLLAVGKAGFAFDYAGPTARQLRRIDGGKVTDIELGASIESLEAVGSNYYSVHKGQRILHVTDAQRTSPVTCDGAPITDCIQAVAADPSLLVVAGGGAPHRVLACTNSVAKEAFDDSKGALTVHRLHAGTAIWALAADDNGLRAWRYDGKRFVPRPEVLAADVRHLAEFDPGYVFASGTTLSLQLPGKSVVTDVLPHTPGSVLGLFVADGTVYCVTEAAPASTDRWLYRW